VFSHINRYLLENHTKTTSKSLRFIHYSISYKSVTNHVKEQR